MFLREFARIYGGLINLRKEAKTRLLSDRQSDANTVRIDHSGSGIPYNIGLVCLSVCLYVCLTITFDSLDVGSSYLHIWCISREY